MNKTTILQSYLHDLLQDHHALGINVELVQDNAKVLMNDSSLSMTYLFQHHQQQDDDDEDDIWMLSDGEDGNYDDLDDDYDEGFLDDLTHHHHRHHHNGSSRWQEHHALPPIKEQHLDETTAKSYNQQPHDKKKKKKKKQKKKSTDSSHQDQNDTMIPPSAGKISIGRSISEDSKSLKDNLRKRAKELLLATGGVGGGGSGPKVSIRRTFSEDGKNLQESLRKRAKELLLATSGVDGNNDGSKANKKDKGRGILRRNSWSNDKLSMASSTASTRSSSSHSRDWEEFSDSQLTIPIRRTSDGEMANAQFTKWDHPYQQPQRTSRSLEFTIGPNTGTTATAAITVDTKEEYTTKRCSMMSPTQTSSSKCNKDTSLKLPTRRNTFESDTALLDDSETTEDEDILSEEEEDVGAPRVPSPLSSPSIWYHHRRRPKNEGGTEDPTASKLKEALEIASIYL